MNKINKYEIKVGELLNIEEKLINENIQKSVQKIEESFEDIASLDKTQIKKHKESIKEPILLENSTNGSPIEIRDDTSSNFNFELIIKETNNPQYELYEIKKFLENFLKKLEKRDSISIAFYMFLKLRENNYQPINYEIMKKLVLNEFHKNRFKFIKYGKTNGKYFDSYSQVIQGLTQSTRENKAIIKDKINENKIMLKIDYNEIIKYFRNIKKHKFNAPFDEEDLKFLFPELKKNSFISKKKKRSEDKEEISITNKKHKNIKKEKNTINKDITKKEHKEDFYIIEDDEEEDEQNKININIKEENKRKNYEFEFHNIPKKETENNNNENNLINTVQEIIEIKEERRGRKKFDKKMLLTKKKHKKYKKKEKIKKIIFKKHEKKQKEEILKLNSNDFDIDVDIELDPEFDLDFNNGSSTTNDNSSKKKQKKENKKNKIFQVITDDELQNPTKQLIKQLKRVFFNTNKNNE